jgi:2-succinyl-6-hydroxy-2,4-cyclohexadiene-1-carboxylate synthase
MFMNYSGIQLNIETIINNNTSDNEVFFLHGFTGCSADWVPIAPSLYKKYNYYLVDLIGHGKSSSPIESHYYYIDAIVNQLKEIILSVSKNKVIIAGYSMGGRIALNFALQYGNLLKGLIVESSTWGINDEIQREERIIQDEKLAEFIISNPIDTFIDYWMNLELFNTQRRLPSEVLARIRERKLENNKIGLANSLRYSGTGIMKPLDNRISDVQARTMLITGELDSKFTGINAEMVKLFTNAEHTIIKNAGHNTHLEDPDVFIEALNKFLFVI